eukprot:comp6021_c0_seq1/m.1866 comp6021_c0_seq1/g.1866  ORF comp6021_c0_seq1/g.1866 comp6021_c0_seq1/m.1866 type:complete len:489 (-) comp6021_c0_seq1:296-1762(-)
MEHDDPPKSTSCPTISLLRKKWFLILCFSVVLTVAIALSGYGIVSHEDLNWEDRDLSKQEAFIFGTFEIVGAMFCSIGSFFAVLLHRRKLKSNQAGTALLPLSVFVVVCVGHALTLFYSAVLAYSTESNFCAIPQSWWDNYWFLVLVVQFPYWVGKPMTILPLTALLLRLVLLYYGYPRLKPLRWLPPSAQGAKPKDINRIIIGFLVIVSIPLIIGFVFDTMRVCLMAWDDPYDPTWDYFQLIYLLAVTGFEMVLVFALYLAKSDLKRYDLDRTVMLVALCVTWWLHLVFFALRKYTVLGLEAWPHYVYLVIMYSQIVLFFLFWYQSFQRSLRLRSGPRLYLADFSGTITAPNEVTLERGPSLGLSAFLPGRLGSYSLKRSRSDNADRGVGSSLIRPSTQNVKSDSFERGGMVLTTSVSTNGDGGDNPCREEAAADVVERTAAGAISPRMDGKKNTEKGGVGDLALAVNVGATSASNSDDSTIPEESV